MSKYEDPDTHAASHIAEAIRLESIKKNRSREYLMSIKQEVILLIVISLLAGYFAGREIHRISVKEHRLNQVRLK